VKTNIVACCMVWEVSFRQLTEQTKPLLWTRLSIVCPTSAHLSNHPILPAVTIFSRQSEYNTLPDLLLPLRKSMAINVSIRYFSYDCHILIVDWNCHKKVQILESSKKKKAYESVDKQCIIIQFLHFELHVICHISVFNWGYKIFFEKKNT